jgi:hypothetical protein
MTWREWWDRRRFADWRLGLKTPDVGEDWEDDDGGWAE